MSARGIARAYFNHRGAGTQRPGPSSVPPVTEAAPHWLEPQRSVRVLHGERIVLRGWRGDDLRPFAELNADPRVMEHFPAPLTRAESDAFVRDRIVPQFAERGFGLWALEVPGVAPFAGYVGLLVHDFEADFTPCVEVGWRLAFPYWGNGYATEGARAALAFGFDEAGLEEIVSICVPANRRSVAVMERLGMTYTGEFDHPRFPPGHRLRRHVLYRLAQASVPPRTITA
jgi:RimJ/RimL family protein N-acetyltransferase